MKFMKKTGAYLKCWCIIWTSVYNYLSLFSLASNLPFSSMKGRPRPNVTWYLENTVIDESFETRKDGITVNHLSYPNIGRQHLNARIVCVASNTNLAPPSNKAVILDVNCKLIQFFFCYVTQWNVWLLKIDKKNAHRVQEFTQVLID